MRQVKAGSGISVEADWRVDSTQASAKTGFPRGEPMLLKTLGETTRKNPGTKGPTNESTLPPTQTRGGGERRNRLHHPKKPDGEVTTRRLQGDPWEKEEKEEKGRSRQKTRQGRDALGEKAEKRN